MPCLTLAVLVGFYLANGKLPVEKDPAGALMTLLASADSGALLIGVAGVLVALGAALSSYGLTGHARALEQAALAIAGIALLIATGHGVEQPLTAAGIHAAAFLVGGILGLRWRNAALAHVATVLLLPATLSAHFRSVSSPI